MLTMKGNSFIVLWSTAAILIAVSTASPTSFSGNAFKGEGKNTVKESGYVKDPERKMSIKQVQTNSIIPELSQRHTLKSIEYECGVISDDIRQRPDTKYVCNFYNHIMKTTNDYTEVKDGFEKCYGFLCSWYKAACNTEDIMKINYDQTTSKEKECACMIKFWRKYSCTRVLGHDDVFDEDITEEEDETDENLEENQGDDLKESGEKNNMDVDLLRKKRAADDIISFPEMREAAPLNQSTSDIVLRMFSTAQRNCFADKKVLYRGECRKIGMEENCGKGHWLVLQKPTGPEEIKDYLPRPVCKPKPCTAADDIWWPTTRQCISKASIKSMICPGEGMKVNIDLFGDGFCECDSEYGLIMGKSGCHSYYQQGPCEFGEVVTHDKATGFAVCTEDLCMAENNMAQSRRKRSPQTDDLEDSSNHHVSHYGDTAVKKRQIERNLLLARNKRENLLDAVGIYDKNLIKIHPEDYHSEGTHKIQASKSIERLRVRRQAGDGFAFDNGMKLYAPMNGNGTCYKLGKVGACESIGPNSRFVINADSHLPACSKRLELHLIDGAPKCKADENNMCRDVVQVKQESDLEFYVHMMNQAKSKRDTRRQG